MQEILSFFKEIFMISDESSKLKVGLSQLKEEVKTQKVKVNKPEKDIKLSDLMRRSA
jgi:hypothetical protein